MPNYGDVENKKHRMVYNPPQTNTATVRSTHCTVRHYGFFDESCCRSLVVLLYLLSQYLNLSEIERLTTSHLIGCENLCTHSN